MSGQCTLPGPRQTELVLQSALGIGLRFAGMIDRQRFRGLFQKYLLVLFMAVSIPLVINGVIEAWFGYRDQRARLDQLLGIQATSAAASIHGFIDGITDQLGWLVQLPW